MKYQEEVEKIMANVHEDDWQKILFEQPDFRKRLMLDFDGVIHRVRPGANGKVNGDPIEGAARGIKFLNVQGFQTAILTARTPDEFPAIRKWLKKHGFPGMLITNHKLAFLAFHDDRVHRFVSWHDITHLHA